jgi:hypothetical protein
VYWWNDFESTVPEQPDPHRTELLEMLILAKGKPLRPYALAKKIDPVSPTRLGNKLKLLLQAAEQFLIGYKMGRQQLFNEGNEGITDEEIRIQALKLLRGHFIVSSFTRAEYRQWDDAQRVIRQMSKKQEEAGEQFDAFIKYRT